MLEYNLFLLLEAFSVVEHHREIIVFYYSSPFSEQHYYIIYKVIEKLKSNFKSDLYLNFLHPMLVWPCTLSKKVKITVLYCRGPIDTGLNCNTEQTQS